MHPPDFAPVYADVIYGCENVTYPESRKSVLHGIAAALLHMQKQTNIEIVGTLRNTIALEMRSLLVFGCAVHNLIRLTRLMTQSQRSLKQSRISNRFQSRENVNSKEVRCYAANFKEFLE